MANRFANCSYICSDSSITDFASFPILWLKCYVFGQLVYEKLPTDISNRHVLLLDPILGTGQPLHTNSYPPFLRMCTRSCFLVTQTRYEDTSNVPFRLLGNTAVEAISLMIKKGVPEANIIFLNLISVSLASK